MSNFLFIFTVLLLFSCQKAKVEKHHFKINDVDFEFVAVEGGEMEMGCNFSNITFLKNDFINWSKGRYSYDCSKEEFPVYSKNIHSFYISSHEVTMEQFALFVQEESYVTTLEKIGGWTSESLLYDLDFYERSKVNGGQLIVLHDTIGLTVHNSYYIYYKGLNWRNKFSNKLFYSKEEYNIPVLNISCKDAMNFCQWMTKKTGKKVRLPNPDEWEYAARGGKFAQHTIFAGSNDLSEVSGFLTYRPNLRFSYHCNSPAKSKKSNELGIYGMGNEILEFCIQDSINQLKQSAYACGNKVMERYKIDIDSVKHTPTSFRLVMEK